MYLPADLITFLAQHVATLGGQGGERWLFRGDAGNPPHQNTFGYWWRKTKKAAEIGSMKLHDLRHFYTSGLIAAGCDVVTVQRALGHASATTTLNTYSHLWPSAEHRTRQAAAGLMDRSSAACGLSADRRKLNRGLAAGQRHIPASARR